MIKNELPKDLATALDCAIRDSNGSMARGYKMKNGKDDQYNNYMSNEEWDDYLAKMDQAHKRQYGMGAGGELKAGKYPPKMASFGSSSRLIYELSKDFDGFIFEERLDTRVGGVANLDGFLRKGSKYIYVEAKRREIYSPSHERQDIKSVYEPVYEWIKGNSSQFDFTSERGNVENGEETKKITFKINEKPIKYFDLKQLICHYLGITYDIAKHSTHNVTIKFLYLLYNPNKVEEKIDKHYRKKVMDRYKEVKSFINANREILESIFKVVLQYQIEMHNLEKPQIDNFEFKLVDQNNYQSELTDI